MIIAIIINKSFHDKEEVPTETASLRQHQYLPSILNMARSVDQIQLERDNFDE